MKPSHRILSFLAAFCLLIPCMAAAEPQPIDPAAIVLYDRTALPDWTPGYGLNMPGVLLELTHAEAMLSVTAVEQGELTQTPSEYLSARLDRAGETLSVSDAQLARWEGQNGADECLLSYSYTYPDGDELHLIRSWSAVFGDLLIDLTVDAWGEDAQQLIDAALAVFVEGGFRLTITQNAAELTASLSDMVESDNGLIYLQLTEAGEDFSRSDTYYPLSQNAVILFPHPDDPMLLTPVAPDYAALADAILLYEESSDSPAMFYTLIENNQIIYMEYDLMQ